MDLQSLIKSINVTKITTSIDLISILMQLVATFKITGSDNLANVISTLQYIINDDEMIKVLLKIVIEIMLDSGLIQTRITVICDAVNVKLTLAQTEVFCG